MVVQVATAASRENSDAASTEEEELAITFQDDLTLSVNEGQATILTASEVKGMTPAELAKYYKVSRICSFGVCAKLLFQLLVYRKGLGLPTFHSIL